MQAGEAQAASEGGGSTGCRFSSDRAGRNGGKDAASNREVGEGLEVGVGVGVQARVCVWRCVGKKGRGVEDMVGR